jgi:hypothetical protein
MTIKQLTITETGAGFNWYIKDGEQVIASSYRSLPTRPEALKSLFGIFFGDYDESFLALYAEFNPDAQFVETQDVGEPVGVKAGDTPWGDADPAL